MIIRNIKNTKEDQRYFDEKAKITEAAKAGRLGKSWFFKNPQTGKDELRPKRIYGKI